MVEIACWLLVGTWLGLTAAANLPKTVKLVRKFDQLDLLPAWTFFAPNPGTSDSIILVRDVFPDGTTSPWRIAWRELPAGGRMWWRPDKRVSKLVTDCCSSIRQYETDRDVTLSSAYLIIAAMVEAGPHEAGANGFQFSTADVPGWWKGNRHPELIYRSAEIQLPPLAFSP